MTEIFHRSIKFTNYHCHDQDSMAYKIKIIRTAKIITNEMTPSGYNWTLNEINAKMTRFTSKYRYFCY